MRATRPGDDGSPPGGARVTRPQIAQEAARLRAERGLTLAEAIGQAACTG